MSRVPDTLIECDCYSAGVELEKLPCGGCRYCTRAHNQWARFDAEADDVIPLSKKVSVTTVIPKQEIRASQIFDPDLTRSDNSQEQEQDKSTLQSEVEVSNGERSKTLLPIEGSCAPMVGSSLVNRA